MIEIDAVLDQDNVIRNCKAAGHAGAGRAGNDIVCAAVSVLMRTAINTLSNRKGIVIKGGAPAPGQVWLEADYNAEGKNFLFAAGEFLINGLSSVAQEFPQNCKLTIRNSNF
ncbi:MAG: ribosomal-processing cysteine protease Prp [Treponema sp.]|nr:ribosomal-processing cysteine protease Prp [Treponema sp.]